MVFSTLLFLFVYLGIVLAVYFLLPKRFRNVWLFITSIFFYAYGEPIYLFLMMASVTLNYVSGLLIEKFREEAKKKKTVLIA